MAEGPGFWIIAEGQKVVVSRHSAGVVTVAEAVSPHETRARDRSDEFDGNRLLIGSAESVLSPSILVG